MKAALLYSLGLLLSFSCSQQDSRVKLAKKETSSGKRIPSDKRSEIKIDSSTRLEYVLPIKTFGFGGGGFFTYDSISISNRKFIFLSSLEGDSAIIKINGKDVYLTPDTKTNKEREGNYIKDGWKGDGFTVVLSVNVVNESGNEVYAKGTIEIKDKHFTATHKIHGGWED